AGRNDERSDTHRASGADNRALRRRSGVGLGATCGGSMAAAGRRARVLCGIAAGRRWRMGVVGTGAEGKPRPVLPWSRDEEVSSEEEAESAAAGRREEEAAAAEEEVAETPQEKKLRLAKLYLEELRRHGEVESGKRLCVVPGGKKGTKGQPMGHTAHILCIAISSDGKYLATGDRNKLILIWEAATCKHLYTFTGHRDAVSGLSFRKGTYQLYSASYDRSVKVWNVEENAYVETLFGHQDVITGMDSLSRECCVTSGGRDGTVRFWKIPEESQLIFYGHQGSIDCIQLINEEHMVSGADDGSVALWGLAKKKPLALVRQSHGMQGSAQDLQQPYWVSAVAALLNSDLVATGSHSGCVKLWKCGEGFQKLESLYDIPLNGFVNSLKFSSAGDFLVAGIGQEHRFGRWWRVKEAKNCICIIPLKHRAGAPGTMAADSAQPSSTAPRSAGAGSLKPV
ncbi:UNVERIFIED_CONTAM: hypothetical protein H355_005427, partial [Colinus virginianus]